MKDKLYFIDNLRIFLIALVILHHLSITYGAPGGWYYKEAEIQDLSILLFAMFTATNQSFFMGMLFMISAYFIAPSLTRKGPRKYLADRLIRLGIPLLFFYFLINPLTSFLVRNQHSDSDLFSSHDIMLRKSFGFGPMWFVETLLYFTILFLIYKSLVKNEEETNIKHPFPGNISIMLFILGTGCLTFIVRIWLPIGWVFQPLELQFPHFIQYVFLFIIGIAAWQNNWLNQISYHHGKRWFCFAQVLIWIGFPLLLVLGGAVGGNPDVFVGGFHWQAFGYAIWEQAIGSALIIGLIGIFKEKLITQGKMAEALSGSAYTVYVFHAPVLVFLTLLLADIQLNPIFKFIIAAPIALTVNFSFAYFIRKLPLARRIL